MKEELKKLKVIEESLRSQFAENRERQSILKRNIWIEENDMELGQIVYVSERLNPLDSEFRKGMLIDVNVRSVRPYPIVKLFKKDGTPGKRIWSWQVGAIKK